MRMSYPNSNSEWSSWFNMDRPWIGAGDVETLKSIEEMGLVCGRKRFVEAAECQVTKYGEDFTQASASSLRDKLRVPCTDKGLLCINADQKNPAHQCHDYAVRFLCSKFNSTDIPTDDKQDSFFPQFDVRIYVILAVVPILIFLIRLLWAFLFRRRRRQRREARRQRNNQDDDNSSISSSNAHPPPSYRELFGELGTNRGSANSIFAITRNNIPVCQRCKETQCCVARATQGSTFLITEPTNPLQRSVSNSSSVTTSVQQNSSPQTSSTGSNGQTDTQGLSSSATISTANDDASPDIQATTATQLIHGNTPTVEADLDQSNVNTTSQPNLTSASQTNEVVSNNQPNGHVVSGSISNQTGRGSDTSEAGSSRTNDAVIQITPDVFNNLVQQNVISGTLLDTTGSSLSSSVTSQELVLATTNTPNSFYGISQPCPCTCHRTMSIPPNGGNVGGSGHDNAGFFHENETTHHFTGMHHPAVPGLQRVWSNLSVGSTVTLSELPSYEDALELMKKKEQKENDQLN